MMALNLDQKWDVVAVAAHPDDLEITCGVPLQCLPRKATKSQL